VGYGGNHITVRYGLSDDDLAGVLAYLAQQQPLEVELRRPAISRPTGIPSTRQ